MFHEHIPKYTQKIIFVMILNDFSWTNEKKVRKYEENEGNM